MTALSHTPLVAMQLASLCRQASKTCTYTSTHLLKPLCITSAEPRTLPTSRTTSSCSKLLCNLPTTFSNLIFVYNFAIGRERWQQKQRWVRTWSSKNLVWNEEQSPYETLAPNMIKMHVVWMERPGIERNADDDKIKVAYRRMAKQFHPDVYNESSGELKEGQTPESYFIQIQAAYELLMDQEQRRQYDLDHRINPLKASNAWMAWVIKKKKSFEQRGETAASMWAEQQQRDMNLKARRSARDKVDPEEERRILAREKAASALNFENTIKRQTLVLKKRDLLQRKAREQAQKKLVQQLLEAEGLELDDERF